MTTKPKHVLPKLVEKVKKMHKKDYVKLVYKETFNICLQISKYYCTLWVDSNDNTYSRVYRLEIRRLNDYLELLVIPFINMSFLNIKQFLDDLYKRLPKSYYPHYKIMDNDYNNLMEALSCINYDSELIVKFKNYLEFEYGQDIGLTQEANELRNNTMKDVASTTIASFFRCWKARKEYAWNPHTSLGQYYLKKEFETLIKS